MSETRLKDLQKPLKEQYREDPEQARITLTARGEQQEDLRSCSIDIGRAIYEAELHKGAGGTGAGACSGDLLLGALAACAQLTAQAVSNVFELDVELEVEVEGDLDLRGTLGMDDEVPVGFEDIRVSFRINTEEELEEKTRQALQKYTEKYCVVYQTLIDPPDINTSWSFEGSTNAADL